MDESSFLAKKSFGGLFVYYQGKLVIVLMDDSNKHYRGRDFDFAPWDGVIIPTDKSYHESLKKQFPFLKTHPVLGKWLIIIPSENLEDQVSSILKLIERNDERIGVYPKPKKKSNKKKGKRYYA